MSEWERTRELRWIRASKGKHYSGYKCGIVAQVKYRKLVDYRSSICSGFCYDTAAPYYDEKWVEFRSGQ